MDCCLKETPMLDFSSESIQRLIQNRNWWEADDFACVRSLYNFVRYEILFGYNADDGIEISGGI